MRVLIGNIRGPQGAKGDTGAAGAAGAAASVTVGTTTTAPYGSPASVTNSGSESAAVLDFVIPQGAPGEITTDLDNLKVSSIQSSAAEYPTIAANDTFKIIAGKINKFFNDILTLANRTQARTTPVAKTMTPVEGITVYRSSCYQIGNLVWISFAIQATQAFDSNKNLFTGLPGSVGTSVDICGGTNAGDFKDFLMIQSGALRTAGAITSGTTMYANGVYRTTS